MSVHWIRNSGHGDSLSSSLASNLRQSAFADVKIICSDGSVWAHRLVLAAVSPVLKHLLLSVENEDVATIYLPQLSRTHLSLVLDYVYRGRMYIKASQLQHVLGVIEVLNLECGVSVSKKVKEEKDENAWVEEAVFKSFNDKGLGEVVKIKQEPLWWKNDTNDEAAIEVRPQMERRRSLRNSAVNEDDSDEDYAVVEVECESDSEEEEPKPAENSVQRCIMCSKVFKHAENLRMHIQSHLGVKAQLRSCQRCKKNFRTSIEHELHLMSHSYVSCLKKVRGLSVDEKIQLKQRSVASKKAQNLIKASIKKLLPKIRAAIPPPSIAGPLPEKPNATTTATTKIKNHHGKRQPNKIAQEDRITVHNQVDRPPSSLGWQSCKLKIKIPLLRADERCGTPKKRKASNASPAGAKSPKKAKVIPVKKQTLEESLTCPTCDKLFVSKSILERHLMKSKHGLFTRDRDLTAPHPLISLAMEKAKEEGRQLPHMNQITQPKIEVGGKEVNKYECHLCKQVFLRVKDLAKHRERMMCSAWVNK